MSRRKYYLKKSWIFLLFYPLWVIGSSTLAVGASPGVLSEITVVYEEGQWHAILAGPQSVSYRAIKVVDPLRLVLDLPNTLNLL
jgi:hypothetical protein